MSIKTTSLPVKMQLTLLFLGSAILVTSGLSIPPRSLGYTYRTSNASRLDIVTLTAYFDLTCIDSKNAYPTLIQLADQLAGKNFELVIRSFSLPYHRNSHVITEALHLIAAHTERKGVFPFVTEIYNNLNSLTTTATHAMTDDQVFRLVTQIGTKTSGISANTFNSEIRNFDSPSRLDFKYGCTRGVYGTPTFMVNDVVVDATPTWTVEEWMRVIRPLL